MTKRGLGASTGSSGSKVGVGGGGAGGGGAGGGGAGGIVAEGSTPRAGSDISTPRVTKTTKSNASPLKTPKSNTKPEVTANGNGVNGASRRSPRRER